MEKGKNTVKELFEVIAGFVVIAVVVFSIFTTFKQGF